MNRTCRILAASAWIALAGPAIAQDSVPPPPAFEAAFDKADENHDGKLTPDEAKSGGFFTGQTFKSADYDEDGTVTLYELGKAVAAGTKDWLGEHDQHDENDDGHVDKDEAKFGSRIRTVFDRADANKDDKIDQDEMKNWAATTYYSEDADYPIVPNIIDEKF
jgi:Ca2+-binding EF-hand superfamily protein